MTEHKLGKLADLSLSATPMAFAGFLGLWALLRASAIGLLRTPAGEAIATALYPTNFFFAENLFVFTLQALAPLGFNDGATLWRLWLRR